MGNDIENKKEVLFKNNKIIKAKYDLTTVQNRIYQFILFKMQQNNDIENNGLYEAHITLDEFKSLIKNRDQWTPVKIQKILTELRKGTIYIEKVDESGNKIWHDYSLITGNDYSEKDNCFRIEASKTIYTLLKEYLKDGYTPVNIAVFLSLSNSYAQRLYELLRLWSNTKVKIIYELDELKNLLLLGDKYDRYPDFRRRVLEPSKIELNDKGKLNIDYKPIKTGRKVTAIEFIVTDNDDRIYYANKNIGQTIFPIDDKNKGVYHIPVELRLEKSCYSRFENRYKKYDFNSPLLMNMLFDAESRTLEKDDLDTIGYKSFPYFQKILDSNLEKNKNDLINNISDSDCGINGLSWNELEDKLS